MFQRSITSLHILPGTLLVLFLVQVGRSLSSFTVEPSGFLAGLKAACDLLSFAELVRDDDRLDELLPWAGNV
jgi:hypothetical protein